MSKKISTSIVIQASSNVVWKVLTDFAKYPEWNPFIKAINGNVERGTRIKAHIAPPGAGSMTFTPKVLAFERDSEFRWLGHLLFPGLFDGEHFFQLADNGNGTTTFIHGENFSGILIPLFRKMIEENTVAGFNLMNAALKERAEQLAKQ